MLKLYNTLSRKIEEFEPIQDKRVGMYSCGPTVYDYAHIGNLRAYVFSDLLKRTLRYDGYDVKHIMNITDVGHLTGDRDMGEDKMQVATKRERKTAWEIASFYTDAFLHDLSKLNIATPDKLPKATDHIKDMIKLVEDLETKGYTYKTGDGIYFDTSKLPDYGKLAKLDLEGLKAGARVEANPEKRNATDFALWKFSYPSPTPSYSPPSHGGERKRDMEWESPWGVGFPGWHIECSAMSTKYLGQPFDIHTGGIDHVPVHHTNEIAQSEAAVGRPLANYWLHSEFIMVNEGRMGKSEGNLITLEELKSKGFSALAYRYFVLQGHYRSKLNFTPEALAGAQNTLHNLYAKLAGFPEGTIGCAEYQKKFFKAMNEDLDTPRALAIMWQMLDSDQPGKAKFSSLMEFDKILGLNLRHKWIALHQPFTSEVEKLKTQRDELRKQHQWAEADKIREELSKRGIKTKDQDSQTGSVIGHIT